MMETTGRVKIGVVGAMGRMGRHVLKACWDHSGVEVVGALERFGHPSIGQDAGFLIGLGNRQLNLTVEMKEVGTAVVNAQVVKQTYFKTEESLRKRNRDVLDPEAQGTFELDTSKMLAKIKSAKIIGRLFGISLELELYDPSYAKPAVNEK